MATHVEVFRLRPVGIVRSRPELYQFRYVCATGKPAAVHLREYVWGHKRCRPVNRVLRQLLALRPRSGRLTLAQARQLFVVDRVLSARAPKNVRWVWDERREHWVVREEARYARLLRATGKYRVSQA